MLGLATWEGVEEYLGDFLQSTNVDGKERLVAVLKMLLGA